MGWFDNTTPAGRHPEGDFNGRFTKVDRFNGKDDSIQLLLEYTSDRGTATEFFPFLTRDKETKALTPASEQQRGFLMSRLLGAFLLTEDKVKAITANASTAGEAVDAVVQALRPKLNAKVRFRVRESADGRYRNIQGGEQGVVPILNPANEGSDHDDATYWPGDSETESSPIANEAANDAASVLASIENDDIDSI